MANKLFIGVDIGKDGGIAVMNAKQELIELIPIPKIGDQVDDLFLFVKLYAYRDDNVTIALEDVHSIFGTSAKSNFAFGEIKGKKTMAAVAMAHIYRWRYVMVQPKEWQGRIWTNSDKIYKPKKPNAKPNARKRVDTKATSLKTAKRLFPQQHFLKTAKSKKPHDGLIDAALIAQYVYLEYR